MIGKLDLAEDLVFNEIPSEGPVFEASSFLRFLLASPLFVGKTNAEEQHDLELVENVLEDLQVSPIRSSRLVEVTCFSHDPEFAARFVNSLVDEFIEHHFESR